MSKEDKLHVMEAGEFELRKAFEDVIRQNIQTIIQYTTETRTLLREAQKSLDELKRMIATRDTDILQLRQQVAILQSKIYQNGTE